MQFIALESGNESIAFRHNPDLRDRIFSNLDLSK